MFCFSVMKSSFGFTKLKHAFYKYALKKCVGIQCLSPLFLGVILLRFIICISHKA